MIQKMIRIRSRPSLSAITSTNAFFPFANLGKELALKNHMKKVDKRESHGIKLDRFASNDGGIERSTGSRLLDLRRQSNMILSGRSYDFIKSVTNLSMMDLNAKGRIRGKAVSVKNRSFCQEK